MTSIRDSALSATAFLDLLAREAAAVEFERPGLEARADGHPPETLAELDRAKAVALRVRALLEHRRRREAELTALVDTVGDLATLRELDAVLEAIVRRARKLLDADIAYMTLHDPERGDTYMRVTDGSVSARFQQLRLPMGTGLGGLVAQTASPYVTPDYLNDGRFRHSDEINGAVAEEGLVAILGVPMRLGARVLGVLFAANRTARPFTRQEVTLLGSLAAHAAVALDNTRLLGETRAALEELSAVNTVVRRHSDALERAAEAHDRMAELILRGGDLDDLAGVVAEVLGGGLAILDGDGRRIAGTLADPVDGGLPEAVAAVGRVARHGDYWVLAVGAGTEALCTLVLHSPGDLAESDRRILERAGVVTALLLLFRRSLAEAEGRVRGELLEDLIARAVDDPLTVRERARLLGVDLDTPHVVVVVDVPPRLRQRAAQWIADRASAGGGLAAQRDGTFVGLLVGNEPGAVARQIVRDLGGYLGAPVTACGAGPVTGPQAVAATYREAHRCTSALVTLGRAGEGASAADLGFVGLLLGGDQDSSDVDAFVDATLGPLLEYDARRGASLVKTLAAYFESGGSAARVAEAVHVHVNTVTQRLGRIGQVLGSGWQQPDRSLELQLALRLHRLRTRWGEHP